MPPPRSNSPSPSDRTPGGRGEDPFDLLGLPARMDLTPARVERAYLSLIASAHPDAMGGAADDLAEEGQPDPQHEARTAALNQARATLLSAEARSLALLARILRERPELSSAEQATRGSRALPAGFLEQMLEAREQIDAAIASDDRAALDRWKQWGMEARAAHEGRAGALLLRLADELPDAARATLVALREEMNAWRYVERLLDQLT